MRKIKRFVLNDSFTVLSAEAQKNVLGGNSDGNSCHNNTSSGTCSGSCVDSYNVTGSCVWVKAYSSCMCATVSVY